MNKEDKIYVAGHRGMVGSAIVRKLMADGFSNIITRTSAELDLRNQQAVSDFFALEKPDHVFLAAAKVGGIVANNTYRAEFIYDNLIMESNIIHHSYLNGVKKLLFLGSSCIYPKMAPQPLKEEYLLSGYFEEVSYSERKYQDIIIRQTGAKHQRFTITKEDFENAIGDILNAMDQPSNDGINTYFITKYAYKAGLKAVLSGIGADELLGGYPSFKRSALLSKSKLLPVFLLHMAEYFNDDKKRKIRFLERKNALGHYLFNRGFFTPGQVAQILDISVSSVQAAIDKVFLPEFVNTLALQEQVSFTETNLYMQNQLLRDTDYMSMWHSVEVRVPFLDKEFMAVCNAIHPSIKYKGIPKHLLIKAFSNILPDAIWNRPKQGFLFPFREWFTSSALPISNDKQFKNMYHEMVAGKIHWSRYWAYCLSTALNKKTQ